ncbi:hypothetical protein BDR05DRAFT_636297 [Suillus weaverae]|nr:hypothetical protein BDR05DRAFT_636297 [Suillus weaverae]
MCHSHPGMSCWGESMFHHEFLDASGIFFAHLVVPLVKQLILKPLRRKGFIPACISCILAMLCTVTWWILLLTRCANHWILMKKVFECRWDALTTTELDGMEASRARRYERAKETC